MKVMKATSTMPSPVPAGDDHPRLNWRGFTWEPVMSTGMKARIATFADVDEEAEATQANHGSMQNVKDPGHSRFDLGTRDVEGYKGEDDNNADADEEEAASHADDGSMQNVED